MFGRKTRALERIGDMLEKVAAIEQRRSEMEGELLELFRAQSAAYTSAAAAARSFDPAKTMQDLVAKMREGTT